MATSSGRSSELDRKGRSVGDIGDPIAWDDVGRLWTIRTQESAATMLRDDHLAVVQEPSLSQEHVPERDAELTIQEFFGSWFSRSPRHAEVRHILNPPYSAKAIASLNDTFVRSAEECLDRLPSEGDLLTDYFTPYGMLTTSRMFDIPDEQWATVTKVTEHISSFLKKPLADSFEITVGEVRAMETSILYLRRVVDHLMAKSDPGPIVQALSSVAATADQNPWLAVIVVGQLLAAGVEPMVNGAGLACRELVARPDLTRSLVTGEISVQQVAEEALRLNPPLPLIHRWAQEECRCYGVLIEPGDHVAVDLRAVNRDPSVFELPDEFRAERLRSLNATFGRGIHTCLGAHSGRLQIAVALDALVQSGRSISVDLARSPIHDSGIQIKVLAMPYESNDATENLPLSNGEFHAAN